MLLRNTLQSISPYSAGERHSGAIKLSSNENPLGSSPLARRALRESIEELHIYPSIPPAELQQAIARWKNVDAAQVICGNGSNEIFTLCAAAVIEPGCTALGSTHTFSQYRFATQLFGGNFRSIPTRELAYDLEAIISAIDEHTRLIFLCSPNNPSGKIIPAEELRWALSRIPENILVVIDQAYGDYADDPRYFDAQGLVPEYPNVLVSGTFSKIFGLAALRLGYGIASESLIRTLHIVKAPFNVNGPAQLAALAALSDTDFIQRSRAVNSESKALFYAGLKALDIEFCETQGNFICIRNPRGGNIADLLKKNNITVRGLASFGLPDYVRITFPAVELTEKILNILEQDTIIGKGA